ncbi:MAG: Do family serine endopeptidase [Neomegalonema sp.]|nr:Do family serine endopeptidase [Neomegalonema sp.]
MAAERQAAQRESIGARTSLVRLGRALSIGAALGAAILLGAGAPTPAMAQFGPTGGFADLAKRLSPSVVNISTAQTVKRPRGRAPQFPPGSPFADLFEDFFDKDGKPRKVESLGTGFIIDAKGIVVTNNHVIDGAEEIYVVFVDGSKAPAKLIGRDKETDLAVLRIEGKGPYPALLWGDSDTARVGDWVVAIGNPFGLGGSVSAGIISARGRDIKAGRYDDFLQTDAAINRGNSGGPLFNMKGKVVGVNTAIISPSGGSIGIGFSIPSKLAKGIVEQLLKYGEVRRGWLGVRVDDLKEDAAKKAGLAKARGAVVTRLDKDGPGTQAGLKKDDVIVRFGATEITNMRSLLKAVASAEIGSTVKIDILRDGKPMTLSATIGKQGAKTALKAPKRRAGVDVGKTEKIRSIGVELGTLTAEARAYYRVAKRFNGVIVVDVDKTSSAYEQGVRDGDVIVEVARTATADPKAARAAIEKELDAGKEKVLLMIARGADVRYIAVKFKR